MAGKQPLPGKKKKGVLSKYLLIILPVCLGIIVWQFIKYKIVHKKIDAAVEKTKGLYSIRYEHLLIDEVTGDLHVKNVEIIPDTAVYRQMVENKTNPQVLITLHLPTLDILGIKTPKALIDKEIDGTKIEINNPYIEIGISDILKDSTEYSPAKELYKQILGKLLGIKIDSLAINQANLVVSDIKTHDVKFQGKNLSFLMTDILIDSLHKDDSSRILFAKNLDMRCEQLLLPSKNKEYQFHLENFNFSSSQNSFSIGKIGIIPQLGEEAFAKAAKLQKDRYDISIENIKILNIDKDNLWHKKLFADSMLIGKSSIKIYRDLSYPHDSLSRVGKFPQQQLMKLSFPLMLKKIVVANSFIEYKERNAKSNNAGKVQFYKVNASISNVTNIPSAIARNNECVVRFRTVFLNKAPLDATLTLFLKNPDGKFTIKGDMKSINGQSLNPLIEPMALAKLENGNILHLNFDLTGNNLGSEGKLTLLYNDIKISLLKKDKNKNKYDKKVLVSLAANFLVKNDNPSKNEKPRTADVNYKRDVYKSFFNLLWKSIFTGVKQEVGIK